MKNIKYIIMSILCMILLINTVSAATITVPENIRVGLEGLYKEKDTVDIGSKDIVFGKLDNNSFVEFGSLSSAAGYSVNTDYNFYIKVDASYSTYAAAKTAIDKLEISGANKYLNYGINSWTILLGGYTSETEMNTSLATLTKKYTTLNLKSVVPTLTRNNITIKDTGKKIIFENSDKYVCFTTKDRLINLVSRTYRGYMQFVRVTSGKMTPVNTLPFEQYLYGVVSSEMSPSWHIEALKAQTIAARNYATLTVSSKKYSFYDISDTTNDQAYKGYNGEGESTTRAVDETKGEVLMFDGKLVSAFYFSSSGGYTDDVENVWSAPIVYLRAVKDIYEIANGNSKWEVTVKKSDIKNAVAALGGNVGEVTDLKLDKIPESGRVLEMTVVGTNGTFKVKKEGIRTFFKPIIGSLLKSRLFDVIGVATASAPTGNISIVGPDTTGTKNVYNGVYVLGPDGVKKKISQADTITIKGKDTTIRVTPQTSELTGDSILIRGAGWGHGVGMSQYGAKGMAEAGFKYQDILKFYYKGTEVVELVNN